MDLKGFLSTILCDHRLAPEIVHRQVLSGNRACFQPLDPPLTDSLSKALSAEGIKGLYLHQAEGIRLSREGRNVVTVTPTASGKTLVYTLPILEQILAEPNTRALMLFPLKALAQDQLKRLWEMGTHWAFSVGSRHL